MLLLHVALGLSAVLAAQIGERNITLAPLLERAGDPDAIPNQYIVAFRDNVSPAVRNKIIKSLPKGAEDVYEEVVNGFSATLDSKTVASLRSNPNVEYIENDSVATADAPIPKRVQNNAPWGLARISLRRKGNKNYRYDSSAGAGTCTYVIDTGIDASHRDFEGRAKQIKSFVKGQTTDGNGHGTHIAGTIGGRVYGVAKKTKLFGIKVLNNKGSTTTAHVIAAFDFVSRDSKKRSCPKGVIVNISITGSYSRTENRAASALARRRIFIAASAGNRNRDASGSSPASEPWVCTVGSTDSNDVRASSSNYGKSVSIFAPGVKITSTLPGGKIGVLSGTSMASAHVAGLAAYLGALEGYRGHQLCNRMRMLASQNILRGIPANTPNKLIFSGIKPR
ncbi:hypothetical protein QQS21_010486 [Conoideocrella luteorostrata]|uniref:Serine protease n=1 Tax=Conoideocrella luteorostrata TaxID=1105319 RepID=A0AAJ0CEX6_9HYPO|nr:hypothetical protein QQS21_010486 [Conoideocrella luteorostrata]